MKRLLTFTFIFLLRFGFAQQTQNPEIKAELPTLIPPSPSVGALMKFEEVPVNNYTGVPDITVPIYSISLNPKISLSVDLKYHPLTTKIETVASDVGLGWALSSVGSISRTVRGIPDEFSSTQKVGIYRADSEYGYNYTAAMNSINSGNLSTDDYKGFAFESLVTNKYDSQYDLWQYNIMGRSGRFYIAKNDTGILEVKMLDNSTFKIINHYQQTDYKPTGFTVYDELGNRYEFTIIETVSNSYFNETTSFNLVMSNSITATDNISTFHLSTIYDTNNNKLLEVEYINGGTESIVDGNFVHREAQGGVNIATLINTIINSTNYQGAGSFFKLFNETSIQSRNYTPKKIKTITVLRKCKIEFEYTLGRQDENYYNNSLAKVLKNIKIKNLNDEIVKELELVQDYFNAPTKKLFLTGINQVSSTETLRVNTFHYKLPNPFADYSKDKWGYFKYASTNELNRETDRDNVMMFVLDKMVLPTGGSVVFNYESNTFSHVIDTAINDYSSNPYNWNNSNNNVQISALNTTTSLFTITSAQNNVRIFFEPLNDLTDYYYRIYKDGQNFDAIHSSICVYGQCEKTFTNLPPGVYTVKLTTTELGINPFSNGYTHQLNFTIASPVSSSNHKNFLYGGGFRIKNIATYDGDVDLNQLTELPLTQKDFIYETSTSSYGVLNSPLPVFEYYLDYSYPSSGSNGGNSIIYKVWSDDDVINRITTKGSEVGYKKVIIKETGNGRTEFEYSTSIEYPDERRSVLGLLELPAIIKDDKRGLLLKKSIYNEVGQILIETENDYEIEEFQPITGVIFHGNYGTGYQTPPLYNFFKNYPLFKNAADNQYCSAGAPSANYCQFDNPSNVFTGPGFALPINYKFIIDYNAWVKLYKTHTTNYFYNDNNIVSTIESVDEFTYNPVNKLIEQKTGSYSTGDYFRTKYFYHTGNNAVTQNRIAEIEEIIIEKNGEVISDSKIVYSNSFPNNNSYLPLRILTSKGNNPLEIKILFNAYDSFGNLLEVQQVDGMKISYLWGYNKTHVVAKIDNSAYSNIPNNLITDIENATNTNIEANVIDALQHLRTHNALQNSLVNGLTYLPLVGVSTIIDPKGIKKQFQYDSFLRLEKIIDHEGNIISKNDYKYRSQNQSSNLNYVKTTTFKVRTTVNPNPSIDEIAEQIAYFDGLGRNIQNISGRMSANGMDLISHIEYDAYGRQALEYLPYVSNQNNLQFVPNAKDNCMAYPEYNNEPVYGKKYFEASPLNRILKQSAPGNSWIGNETNNNDHTLRYSYQTNEISDAVKSFNVFLNYDSNNNIYIPQLIDNGLINESTLEKIITKNENWIPSSIQQNNNTTHEYRNIWGQVVLKRTFLNNLPLDTYYVYDIYGNLTFVIPPKASKVLNISTTILNNLCYQYRYDKQNRMVAKKIPGKAWEFMVYDKLNRIVANGPTFNPFGNGSTGWLHTKFDAYGRPAYTLWKESQDINDDSRSNLQNNYNNSTRLYESLTGSNVDSLENPYSSDVYPQNNYLILTINFYDGYQFANAPNPLPQQIGEFRILTNCKGLSTGNWIRVLESSSTTVGETNYSLFNYRGEVLKSVNHNYLGGKSSVETINNFAGLTSETTTYHQLTNINNPIIIKEQFEHSVQGRIEKITHQINSQPKELMVFNEYDDLGKLKKKHVGGTDFTSFTGLQIVDFNYNIRGWLTGINNTNNLNNTTDPKDLFAFKINYDQVEVNGSNSVEAQYNGNISKTFWRSANDNVLRSYAYKYDDLNRLEEAFYQKPGLTSPNINNYREFVSYDENGNILTLQRNGNLDSLTEVNEIDDLTYTYMPDSNLLLKVTDASLHPLGFKDDSTDGTLATDTSDDYNYDILGNLLSDENKGITKKIQYNHLNLPLHIKIDEKGEISYIYNALGKKVRKLVKDDVLAQNKQVDYSNGFQYENGIIQFFPTTEGYAARLTTKEENDKLITIPINELREDQFYYVYNYTDHLGNIRLSYTLDPETQQLKIIDQNHYYPFGMRHTNYSGGKYIVVKDEDNKKVAPAGDEFITFKYKFNGFEWQDELGLNLYDFGSRNYDPSIARWINVDLMAENSRKWSPYNYCYNNPVYFIDPDGMQSEGTIDIGYGRTTSGDGSIGAIQTTSGWFKVEVEIGKGNHYIDTNGGYLGSDGDKENSEIRMINRSEYNGIKEDIGDPATSADATKALVANSKVVKIDDAQIQEMMQNIHTLTDKTKTIEYQIYIVLDNTTATIFAVMGNPGSDKRTDMEVVPYEFGKENNKVVRFFANDINGKSWPVLAQVHTHNGFNESSRSSGSITGLGGEKTTINPGPSEDFDLKRSKDYTMPIYAIDSWDTKATGNATIGRATPDGIEKSIGKTQGSNGKINTKSVNVGLEALNYRVFGRVTR